MGRWEPGAGSRLRLAAMELYTQQGFEQTTVTEIAARAGVTERTFFRHFADKREVLFEGSGALQDAVLESIATAPAGRAPIDVVLAAMIVAAGHLQGNIGYARLRSAVIAANASLQERELLKLSRLGSAAAHALRQRGVGSLAAEIAADAGVTVFRIGFDTWVSGPDDGVFAERIADAFAELRALAEGAEHLTH